MTLQVRSSRPASEELVEAVRWYEAQRPGLGRDFFAAVSSTIALIAERPGAGATLEANVLIRRILVPRFPYQLIYRSTRGGIVIVAVAHLKRRPRYWEGR